MILEVQAGIDNQFKADTKLKPEKIFSVYKTSLYQPSDEEKQVRTMILRHFVLGDMTMQRPRVEFNDMSVITRSQYDRMSFNTYQPNNGDGLDGDLQSSWRSNAIRPIIRNKAMSIAAHATARLIFPKVFAYDSSSTVQNDAATVMEDLMEGAADKSNYSYNSLLRVLTAFTDPISIGYTEYAETYREIKTKKEGGNWKKELVLDETLSGFQDYIVPCNELYIENFFEPDIQKQGWLIWRKVISYSLAEAKYKNKYKNFEYVVPGVQTIFNDANQSFYEVYDANMRQDDVEEIIYWNRTLDLKIVMVNGILMTESDEANPRLDKRYPFDTFYYEMISPKCFYGKSLAFKLQQDAKIVNDLYQMIIDGTYLSIMPPMVNSGGESITSDVIVPGAVTTLKDPNSEMKALGLQHDLVGGIKTMAEVEKSINESSQDPIEQGVASQGTQTAYEISRLEQNAATVLGLFIKMISKHVKEYGKLRVSDIVQYLTIADVSKVEDNAGLVYKSFLLGDKNSSGKTKTRKIEFDGNMKPDMTPDEVKTMGWDLLSQEDKLDKMEIYKVQPENFRKLTFDLMVSPDVLNPKSEDLLRAWNVEAYDRLINNPLANQEEALRLLLGSYDMTKKDPDKFIAQAQQGMGGLPTMNPANPANPAINQQQILNAMPRQMMSKQQPLPQTMPMAKV